MGRRFVPLPVAPSAKVCRDCRQLKPISEYYTKSSKSVLSTARRHINRCKVCFIKYTADNRNRRLAASRTARVAERERKYAWLAAGGRFRVRYVTLKKSEVTKHAYDLQFTSQNGRCAVCLRVPCADEMRFPFDHDHVTGLARGVLCSECNNGLGCFKDRPELLKAALKYLVDWAQFHLEILPEVVNE